MRRSPAELYAMDKDALVTYCLTLQNLLDRDGYAEDIEGLDLKDYLTNLRRQASNGTITREDLLAASLRVGEDATDPKDRLKALELARKTMIDIDNAPDDEDDESFDDIMNSRPEDEDDLSAMN